MAPSFEYPLNTPEQTSEHLNSLAQTLRITGVTHKRRGQQHFITIHGNDLPASQNNTDVFYAQDTILDIAHPTTPQELLGSLFDFLIYRTKYEGKMIAIARFITKISTDTPLTSQYLLSVDEISPSEYASLIDQPQSSDLDRPFKLYGHKYKCTIREA